MTTPGFETDPEKLEGIRPEDIVESARTLPRPDTSDRAEALVREALKDLGNAPKTEDERFELTDNELMEALKIFEELGIKYQDRPKTFANTQSLRKEAIEKFDKIGLVVEVDTLRSELTEEPPIIEIVDRKGPIDVEEYFWSIQKGVADEVWEDRRKRAQKKQKGINA